jgi:hypothetical protein
MPSLALFVFEANLPKMHQQKGNNALYASVLDSNLAPISTSTTYVFSRKVESLTLPCSIRFKPVRQEAEKSVSILPFIFDKQDLPFH